MVTTTSTIIERIGNKVIELSKKKSSSWWYRPHMAAASRAINQRMPLVDFVLEVRDARIPSSSAYESLKCLSTSSRHIIVFNKAELAPHSQLKEWMGYFEQRNNICVKVNARDQYSVRKLLKVLQRRVADLMRIEHSRHTLVVMLVGIPNVGKSSLANSLHQIGRLTAEEKGELKHAVVSRHPGDTIDITSFKVGSHPSIYVLDTPGVLAPKILDAETCCRLALTGAIDDIIVGPTDLAQYFLSIVNLGKEYQNWDIFSITDEIDTSDIPPKKCYAYTQDIIANNVRRTLYDAITSFDGDLGNEDDLAQLIETELRLLHKAFYIPPDLEEDGHAQVATKLIRLFRSGRLGLYVFDPVSMQS